MPMYDIKNEIEENFIQSESDEEMELIENIIFILNIKDDRDIGYLISRELKHDNFGGAFHLLIYQNLKYTLSVLYFDDDNSCIITNLYTNAIKIYKNQIMPIITDYMIQLYELAKIENHPNNYILK
jgi:hypothetical protein